MAAHYLDTDTLNFLLFSVHDLSGLMKQPRFRDYDEASVAMFLKAVTDFSDQELFPYFREMDRDPAYFRDGEIIVHPQVTGYVEKAGEMGLIGAPFDYEDGGLQMPAMVVTAAAYIQEAANNHLPGYAGLTLGAAELILHFGSHALKDTYAPKMLSGQWSGTMCLTEPQAGSSLSDIVTEAVPDGDHYKISGQKIFISGGDYKGAVNVVHLLLARIKGAPAGTRGISLFVVPKNRPGENGTLHPNDVNTIGDFEKMGQKGYCTTHLSFGDGGDCRGWLVGEAHQGLHYMFKMMNGARIAVGRGAAAIAMAAYRASLAYARERPQGRRLASGGKKDVSQGQTLIINHPDVKRMLLTQKAVAEGALSLILLAARYQDLSLTHPDEGAREKYLNLLEILTPIAKTYPAEMGAVAVSNGLQVLGGYGFCSDFILQQYYRDIRIFSIYEGTTGIQALDLLGRKITMDKGNAWRLLTEEINQSIEKAAEQEALLPYSQKLKDRLGSAQEVLKHLSGHASRGDFEHFLADATVFMEFLGNIVVGWLWLDIGAAALQAADTGKTTYERGFYREKLLCMRFYYNYELPKTVGLAEVLLNQEGLTLESPDSLFGE